MRETRFKDTEIGLIPEDWEVTTIRDFCDVKTGPFGSVLHSSDYVLTGTPIITVEHLGMPFIDVKNGVPMVSDKDKIRLSAYSLKTGDLVFSRVGSVDRNCIVTEKEDGWLFSGRLLRVRPNSTVYTPYLSYHLYTEQAKNRVLSVAVGLAMPSINTKILSGISVAIPLLKDEQVAIASALSDVDVLLRELGELIAKKKAIKMGMMQELLTVEAVPGKEGAFRPKRRLKGFEGDWVEKRLGEIGVTFNGLTGKSAADFGTGKSRYITFLNVLNNPIIDLTILEKVDVRIGEKQNAVKRNDLLFNTSSETPEEVGICSVLLDDVDDVYLNSFCFGYRLTDDEVLGLYLAYFFRCKDGRNLMTTLAQGSTRYNLSKDSFLKSLVVMPSTKKEQTAIAEVLSDMDAEIAALEAKRAKYEQVKNGMMQELLTGKIRLV